MMMKIILTALLLLAPLSASALTADELAAKAQESYDRTRDLRADFVQVSYIKAVDATKESSGVLLVKKPGLLRYTYTRPERQEVIVRGEDVTMYNQAQNQVLKKRLDKAVMDRTPSAFLAGTGRIADTFDARIPGSGATDGKGRLVLDLVPKGEKMGVERFTLVLDPGTYGIVGFSFTETGGNVNTTTLSRVKVNRGIKDDAFSFRIPKGASLIAQ